MQLIRRIALLFLLPLTAVAGVLPDDRADLMYHSYDGGGVTIDGPSLLVRKKFAEKYAVNASYYIDMVSSRVDRRHHDRKSLRRGTHASTASASSTCAAR